MIGHIGPEQFPPHIAYTKLNSLLINLALQGIYVSDDIVQIPIYEGSIMSRPKSGSLLYRSTIEMANKILDELAKIIEFNAGLNS